MMLERNSSISMYEQIVSLLKEDIRQKRVPGDGCLGTHKELAEKYNVSIITIRKALQVLETQGIVEIKQGKGTFVSRNLLANKHNFFTNYVDVLFGEDNDTHNTRVLMMAEIDTPDYLPGNVVRLMGPTCYCIARTHSLESRVVDYAKSYLPIKYGGKITSEEAACMTTYEMLVEKCNVTLGRGFQRIFAIRADAELAEKLNMPLGEPLTRIERESYSADGELVELLEQFSTYSQYEYTISLELGGV